MPYNFQPQSSDAESVRKIHICSHCGDPAGKNEKFCGKCDSEEKRAKLKTVNEEIQKELKIKYQ